MQGGPAPLSSGRLQIILYKERGPAGAETMDPPTRVDGFASGTDEVLQIIHLETLGDGSQEVKGIESNGTRNCHQLSEYPIHRQSD